MSLSAVCACWCCLSCTCINRLSYSLVFSRTSSRPFTFPKRTLQSSPTMARCSMKAGRLLSIKGMLLGTKLGRFLYFNPPSYPPPSFPFSLSLYTVFSYLLSGHSHPRFRIFFSTTFRILHLPIRVTVSCDSMIFKHD